MKEIKGFENYSIDEKGNVFNNKNKEIIENSKQNNINT